MSPFFDDDWIEEKASEIPKWYLDAGKIPPKPRRRKTRQTTEHPPRFPPLKLVVANDKDEGSMKKFGRKYERK